MREFVKKEDLNPEETRVVIQGFGNVGANIARILNDWGYKIIGLSDAHRAIYDEKGLDIRGIIARRKTEGTIPKMIDVKEITNKELLELDCDVLIPAAISHQITDNNADKIKAKVVLEMANASITSAADKILFSKNIKVIPDILANSGGVVVSYFEWSQNSANEHWLEKEVFKKLKKKMVKAFNSINSICLTEKCDLRTAAHIMAIKRIVKVERLISNL